MTEFAGKPNFRQKKSSIATVQHMLLINWNPITGILLVQFVPSASFLIIQPQLKTIAMTRNLYVAITLVISPFAVDGFNISG
ncbi:MULTISPECIES: hypothetical protein [Acinetobacter]|uniref:hypothetical protein n=1 Tax=Acinetobacter TaxID=469 RepID=UPI0009D6A723|nr:MULTISPECIES: hypothetical protein [Acinetobacter]MBA0154883.1 hypothetical protein [Acinetobacter indicus]